MAVDRQLRDEMDRLIVGAIRHEIPDGYARLIDLLEAREGDADAARDEGAQVVALGVTTGNWRVWRGYDWNEEIYQKHRRLIAFLRSDVDYAEREAKRVRTLHKWRLAIVIISTIVAIIMTTAAVAYVGKHGLWLWFAASIPMLVGMWFHQRRLNIVARSRSAPFESVEQFRQHEHLADRPPTLPPLNVLNPPLHGWPLTRRTLRRMWDGGSACLFMGVLFLYVVATWPVFLYENWVCMSVGVAEDAREAE